MQSIRQQFTVSFRYDVRFTEDLFSPGNPLLAATIRDDDEPGPRKTLFVVDDGLLPHYPDLLDRIATYTAHHAAAIRLVTPPLLVPGGEAAKNDPALVEQIQRAVDRFGICRHSYVVAVGGGAVLDLVGYAAATAHRGVRHIRVPTTVLSQDDSGIGVKNGVNAFGKKNFIGTFTPPYAVLNDALFLETLDHRDWRAGIAEAIKVALIKDAPFFDWLRERAAALAPPCRDMAAMRELVYRSAHLHINHIGGGDPFETGSSRPLDFGHWAAHKLEQLTGYDLRHGEAVAIGIALDCVYAHLAGRLDAAPLEAVLGLFDALGFTLFVPELAAHLDEPTHPRSLFRGLDEFREHLGGRLTILLLEGVGRAVEVHEVDLDLYRQAVARLQERAALAAVSR